MTYPLVAKVPALVALLIAERYAFISPRNLGNTVTDNGQYGRRDVITRIAHWFPYVSVGYCQIVLVLEIVVILAQEYPQFPFSSALLSALLKDRSSVYRLTPTSQWIFGFIILVVGAAIRKACYVALGNMFTFELAIVEKHKLITSGPYSIVRHPAYTGFVMAINGLIITQLLPGSYLAECGVFETVWVRVVASLWGMWLVLVQLVAIGRTVKEDAVLRKEFGAEWDRWAKKTQYRLIPYVY